MLQLILFLLAFVFFVLAGLSVPGLKLGKEHPSGKLVTQWQWLAFACLVAALWLVGKM